MAFFDNIEPKYLGNVYRALRLEFERVMPRDAPEEEQKKYIQACVEEEGDTCCFQMVREFALRSIWSDEEDPQNRAFLKYILKSKYTQPREFKTDLFFLVEHAYISSSFDMDAAHRKGRFEYPPLSFINKYLSIYYGLYRDRCRFPREQAKATRKIIVRAIQAVEKKWHLKKVHELFGDLETHMR